jgi:hypothetical protein
MNCLLDCVADPLPNMIMSSDRGLVTRTSSTREPRAFHLSWGNPLLYPNQRSSLFDVNVFTPLSPHPSTASLLDDPICPPAQHPKRPPMTYLCPPRKETCTPRGQIGPLTPRLWYPGHRPLVTWSWLYAHANVLSSLLSTLDVALLRPARAFHSTTS